MAQTAQCPSGWEWNQNSLGQDPCAVATILDSYCRSDPSYTYPKLDPGEWYIPPSTTHGGDLTCDCDTVMYSLTMACSTCQGGIAYGWDLWIQQCNTVLISDYSGYIPQGTVVPRWAFYNVTLLDNEEFDNGNAQNIGRDPEALPDVPTPSATNESTAGAPRNTPAIIGGVVGGVGLLIIIVTVYFGYRWWRKNERMKQQRQWDNQGAYESQWSTSPHSPTSTKYAPSISTLPPLSPNRGFQPRVLPSMPPQTANRPATWVTPISNDDPR